MTFLGSDFRDASWDDDDGSTSSGSENPSAHTGTGGRRDAKDTESTDWLDEFWPHVPAVRRYLRRRVVTEDVEDVLQDVFVNIIRRSDGSIISHPRCYLFRAAQAALVDRHRRQSARRQSHHCEFNEADAPVDEHSPLRILLARNDVRAAEDILSELPKRTQEIIIAVRLEGMSLKSLASRYNVTTSAIEKHVTKASKALSCVRKSKRAACASARA